MAFVKQGVWPLGNIKIPLYVQCKDTSHCSTAMVLVNQNRYVQVREFIGVLGRVTTELGQNTPPIGIFATTVNIRNSMLRLNSTNLLICRESALSSNPLILLRVQNQRILSLQPNSSLLRAYPSIQFLFDVDDNPRSDWQINRTNIPTIMFEGKCIFGDVIQC